MSLCRDFQTAPVCATDADGVRTTLTASYEMGTDAAGNAVLVATRYLDASGAVVDVTGSTVVAGACPVMAPDVEFSQLCDTQTDGTTVNFMCRTITSFDAAGAPVDPSRVDYFEMDKVTPYTPTGTVKPGGDCPPATARGVLTSWG